ncbi:acyl-CoA dehydrogenase family protein [Streptomyces sp. NPDC048385]|uniref:acyl-CoA dehydrogenase family protein n=1 Tax=unclassified Streptomyces TaxID=2593676 RepID=UPI00344726D5
MDFTPTEAQAEARDLAARIFGDLATHERLRAAGTGSDPELWKALTAAGLVAAVSELGLLGLVLLLEEQGRTTAQVPYAASCVYGQLAIAAHGTGEQRERLLPGIGDGSVVVTGAFPAQPSVRPSAYGGSVEPSAYGGSVEPSAYGGSVGPSAYGGLSGTVPVVPWLRDATHVLVADAERRLWLVPIGEGTSVEEVELTAPWSAGRLTLQDAPAEPLGSDPGSDPDPDPGPGPGPDPDPDTGSGSGPGSGTGAYADVLATARTAFAGLQAGVCAGSLARAVAHTNAREQFGRPLATRQGVQLRAADAHMDTEAIRVTAYEAAWRRDTGLPYATHALTAAWWASEAGQRVVHTGQHLHGGTGADVGHPVHRHFLWGRQLDAYLGNGGEVLQELGELIASGS